MSKMVKMTREQVLTVDSQLEGLSSMQGTPIFAYSIVKNRKLLETEVKAIMAAVAPSEAYIEYERNRRGICNKFANKDGRGTPIIRNNSFEIPPEKIGEFNLKVEELKEAHKEAFDEQEKKSKENKKFLEEEIELSIIPIDVELFPGMVTPAMIGNLLPIIKEDEEPQTA